MRKVQRTEIYTLIINVLVYGALHLDNLFLLLSTNIMVRCTNPHLAISQVLDNSEKIWIYVGYLTNYVESQKQTIFSHET